jgi:CheY-like chemotaxis protein
MAAAHDEKLPSSADIGDFEPSFGDADAPLEGLLSDALRELNLARSRIGVASPLYPHLTRALRKLTTAQERLSAPLFAGRGLALVVDDDQDMRRALVDGLRRLGFQTLEAADGVDALEIVEGGAELALVVMDLVMPRMGGGEAMDRMRETAPKLPIILASAHLEGDPGDALTRALRKPFRLDALQTCVDALVPPPEG